MSSLPSTLSFLKDVGLLAAIPALALGTAAVKGPAANAPANPDNFVPLEDITAPIIDAGRIDGQLDLSLVIEAGSPEDAANLGERRPELRAAMLASSLEFARLHASPFTPVDAGRLSEALVPAARKVDPRVARVLIVKVGAFGS